MGEVVGSVATMESDDDLWYIAAVVKAEDCMYFELATKGDVRWLIMDEDCHAVVETPKVRRAAAAALKETIFIS